MIDSSAYSAAIFDLDGVITDTAPLHFQAWKATADKLGIEFNHADNEQLKGVDRMASMEFILKLGNRKVSDPEKIALADEKNSYYRQLLQQLTSKDVLPGVRTYLQNLRAQGIKIGLASASRNAPDILHALQLTDSFDHIANPSLARSKPAPDIFLYAAYGLGVHPENCIAFEDAVAGLKAIKAAGMFAVSVGDSTLEAHSDSHLNSFIECC
ncbi:beta-phosphoglucomutase [Reinekea sp. G2M2-21]|uniref:beta-phosphoglucomutase n=1 Tax=Reinekea sp. G2M2-21 TaxID=2788942 RepID=UPI0018A9457F|nr:beta-phosphoglucomutase [Reinekea sp. G2M2-21]